MIIAALMTFLIWLVILLLRAVIKSDQTGQEEVGLGLFAYTAKTQQAFPKQPKWTKNRA